MLRRAPVLAAVLAALALTSASADAATITEYPAASAPDEAVLGPDGNVWFTEPGVKKIGRITPAGTITEFLITSGTPQGIAAGPDGNLWYTVPGARKIGRMTTLGTILNEYSLASGSSPQAIAAGPDGNLWFTDTGTPVSIGKITTSGQVTKYTTGVTSVSPWSITAGPDGAMWFVDHKAGGNVSRITTAGAVTDYPGASGLPQDIVTGPDGNLWFTEGSSPGKIARITPTGTISEFPVITPNQNPMSIAVGGDGRLYFTENTSNGALGAITTSGTVSEFTAGLTVQNHPAGIAAGGDGNVWFTEGGTTPKLGRLTAPPAASTGSAAGITNDAATVVGSVTPTTEATTSRFEYGTSTSYGSLTSWTAATTAAGTAQSVSTMVSGLNPSTTYHFRVVATNATGTTAGADQTFTTSALPTPAAFTGATTGIGMTAATLGGTVNPNGLATTYHFEWGPTTSYGSQAPASDGSLGADSADHAISAQVSGLTAATTYHYRLVATNSSGTTRGADQTFTTAAPPAPVVTTGATTGVGETSATLAGEIGPSGLATTYRFEWGATTSYGRQAPVADASLAASSLTRTVTEQLAGLTAGTSYHYRLVASNASGTTYGDDGTFTTRTTAGRDISSVGGATPGAGDDAADEPGDSTPDGAAGTASLPPVAKPVRGRSVAVEPASGSVTIRLPGTTHDVPLGDAGSRIPVGAVVDATHGQVALTSALDSAGHVQTGRFWGGRFTVAQQRTSRMTTIHLADRTSQCAPKAASAVAARVAKKRRPSGKAVVNRLWGRDDHGAFRTIGRNASATVRGTQWLTEDRCDGTLVRVAKGAVLVTNRRTHRSVLVRAGGQHLAR